MQRVTGKRGCHLLEVCSKIVLDSHESAQRLEENKRAQMQFSNPERVIGKPFQTNLFRSMVSVCNQINTNGGLLRVHRAPMPSVTPWKTPLSYEKRRGSAHSSQRSSSTP